MIQKFASLLFTFLISYISFSQTEDLYLANTVPLELKITQTENVEYDRENNILSANEVEPPLFEHFYYKPFSINLNNGEYKFRDRSSRREDRLKQPNKIDPHMKCYEISSSKFKKTQSDD